MGKERAYLAKLSITSGDRCRASLPGLALLLSMEAGEADGGQARLVGAGDANGGRKPPKPSGQIPCQHNRYQAQSKNACGNL